MTKSGLEHTSVGSSCLACTKTCIQALAVHTIGVVAHAFIVDTQELEAKRLEVQCYLWLYGEFRASLEHTTSYVKKKKKM